MRASYEKRYPGFGANVLSSKNRVSAAGRHGGDVAYQRKRHEAYMAYVRLELGLI
jgi:hypothetical protein